MFFFPEIWMQIQLRFQLWIYNVFNHVSDRASIWHMIVKWNKLSNGFYVFKFRLLFKLAMRTHLFFTSCQIRVFFSLNVNTKKSISPCHKEQSWYWHELTENIYDNVCCQFSYTVMNIHATLTTTRQVTVDKSDWKVLDW